MTEVQLMDLLAREKNRFSIVCAKLLDFRKSIYEQDVAGVTCCSLRSL